MITILVSAGAIALVIKSLFEEAQAGTTIRTAEGFVAS